jgi:hypothetical protein
MAEETLIETPRIITGEELEKAARALLVRRGHESAFAQKAQAGKWPAWRERLQDARAAFEAIGFTVEEE